MKILIVDDASFVRMALTKTLQEDGHEIVAEAVNGADALEKYKLSKPELVIMDITMPEVDGLEGLHRIMEYDANAIVIMCSSMGQKEHVVQAIQSGAKDFIVKPFDKERVKEAVRRYR